MDKIEFSKLLAICHRAQINHSAAQILNSELPSNIELIIPHINNSWTALESLREFLFSDTTENKTHNKKQKLQNRFNNTFQDYKSLTEELSNIEIQSEGTEQQDLIRKTEIQLAALGELISQVKNYIMLLSGWKPVYQRLWFYLLIAILISGVGISLFYRSYKDKLLGFKVVSNSQEWGSLNVDRSVEGNKLRVAGVNCETGLGTHATSEIDLKLKPDVKTLEGVCGLDLSRAESGSIECQITQGKFTLFKSEVLRGTNSTASFSVTVKADLPVTLWVQDAADGNNNDHANWCNLIAK